MSVNFDKYFSEDTTLTNEESDALFKFLDKLGTKGLVEENNVSVVIHPFTELNGVHIVSSESLFLDFERKNFYFSFPTKSSLTLAFKIVSDLWKKIYGIDTGGGKPPRSPANYFDEENEDAILPPSDIEAFDFMEKNSNERRFAFVENGTRYFPWGEIRYIGYGMGNSVVVNNITIELGSKLAADFLYAWLTDNVAYYG